MNPVFRYRARTGSIVPPTAVRGLAAGLVCMLAWACGGAADPDNAADPRRAVLPAGAPSDVFTAQPVGEPRGENERPLIAHVEIVDLDADGLPDILACDAVRNRVAWIRQFPAGTWTERPITEEIRAPAHVEPTDFDGDGDLDLLVASLGELFPSDLRIGSVVVLENDGDQRFASRVAAERLPRVADVRAGDLDGDGDLDLAVAAFGYDHGETLWLENRGDWAFETHVLQRFSGAINALAADLDEDGARDIVSLVSQEWEEIWAFPGPQLRPRLLWGTTNPGGTTRPDDRGPASSRSRAPGGRRTRRSIPPGDHPTGRPTECERFRALPALPELSGQPPALREHLEAANRAARDRPTSADAVGALGTADLATNAAWREYLIRRALEFDPDHDVALAELAATFRLLRRYEEALELLERRRRERPDDFGVLADIGRCLSGLRRYREAEEMLRQALEGLDNAPTRYELGAVLAASGRPGEAIAEYRRALDRNPNHLGTLNNLGVLLAE